MVKRVVAQPYPIKARSNGLMDGQKTKDLMYSMSICHVNLCIINDNNIISGFDSFDI